MCETPFWRFEPQLLPLRPYKHLYLRSNHHTKDVRWLHVNNYGLIYWCTLLLFNRYFLFVLNANIFFPNYKRYYSLVEAFSFSVSVRVYQLCCSLFCGCEPSCVCEYIYFGLMWMWTFYFYMFKYEDDLKYHENDTKSGRFNYLWFRS